MKIEITNHIVERYIERFNPNLSAIKDFNQRLIKAKRAIIIMLNDAKYVSDDERGILMYSPGYNCNIIIRRRRLITLYEPGTKVKQREEKHK